MTTIKTLLSVAVLAATTGSVWADGTIAGTDINNTATINYSVGGTAQTAIKSAPGAGNSTPGTPGTATTFVVDKKIDLVVTGTADANVAPLGTADLTFTLKNDGNDKEFFSLATLNASVGDDFNMTGTCTTTVNSVTSPVGIPAHGLGPSVTSPLELVPDGVATITVNCTAPATGPTVSQSKTSDVNLIATAVTTSGGSTAYVNTPGADTAGSEDIVLADALGSANSDNANDSKHSAFQTYTVNTADLNVTKTSVVSDARAFNSTNPKRIPGATIVYTITVDNAVGAVTATDIVITDTVQGDLTIVSAGLVIDNAVSVDKTPASGQLVSSGNFTLAANKSAVLTITATVK